MTIPPHIANAPTPRTDKSVGVKVVGTVELADADNMRQLERENLYLREVLEELRKHIHHNASCNTQRHYFSEKRREEQKAIGCDCTIKNALSAYEQLKKDLSQ